MKQYALALLVVPLALMSGVSAVAQNSPMLYGYFSTRIEKSFAVPSVSGNGIVKEDGFAEWSVPFLNVMVSHQVSDRAKVYINLNGAKASNITVQNYWGEYSFANLLTVRLGKIYRKFGLYNEILDAVPTYYGIEPPELFDADHLIISRTTTLMFYGNHDIGLGQFNYSFSTDNGESGSPNKATPLGYDFNYRFGEGNYLLGVSGYTSGGETSSDVSLGSGSPKSGVLPWMANDKFSVFGGYAEAKIGALTFQAEYWRAPHSIQRDTTSVMTVIAEAGPNAAQLARFMIDPAGPNTGTNIRVNDTYTVQTYYIKAGYSFETAIGEVGPYVQWDWYKNVETISNKSFGGDAEAGEADDGQFTKSTLGIVYRPIPQLAAKFDGSSHNYKLNGEKVSYIEARFDVSYVFGQ